jgi:hypothetical protein
MTDDLMKMLDEKMGKTKIILKEDLNAVRAGRANPALLDKIRVEYYGTPTPLKNIAKGFFQYGLYAGSRRLAAELDSLWGIHDEKDG